MGDSPYTATVKASGVADSNLYFGIVPRLGVGVEIDITALNHGMRHERLEAGLEYNHYFGDSSSNRFAIRNTMFFFGKYVGVGNDLLLEIGEMSGGGGGGDGGGGYLGIGEDFYSSAGSSSSDASFWQLALGIHLVVEPLGKATESGFGPYLGLRGYIGGGEMGDDGRFALGWTGDAGVRYMF